MRIYPECTRRTAESVLAIDFGALRQQDRIDAVVFDLDMTLCPRGATDLPQAARQLLASAPLQNVKIGILSNRRRAVNTPIIHELSARYPVVSHACKPLKRGFQRILAQLDVAPDRTVMIGDKWSTDILGAMRMRLAVAIRVRHPLR